MPLRFAFDASYLTTAPTIERGIFTQGSYPGLDYPTYYSAIAPDQAIVTRGGAMAETG